MGARQNKLVIQEYFRKLLREDIDRHGRGRASKITEAVGIPSAHLSNMTATPPTRNPGLDTMHKLAQFWGRAYAEIEAEALGMPAPVEASREFVIPTAVEAVRMMGLSEGYEVGFLEEWLATVDRDASAKNLWHACQVEYEVWKRERSRSSDGLTALNNAARQISVTGARETELAQGTSTPPRRIPRSRAGS